MQDDLVDLQAELARTEELSRRTRGIADAHLPLAVAAALAFHQVHGNTKAIVTRQDYDDALNIAASALSRLVPVYTLRDAREGRVVIAVDLTQQRFARGATQLRSADGTIGELSLKQADAISAISLIKRAGLPFSLALSPARKG